MVLKIDRRQESKRTVVFLSGRISTDELAALESAIRAETKPILVDMREVRLIDREAIGAIAEWLDGDIKLRNCPAYAREWINWERKNRS